MADFQKIDGFQSFWVNGLLWKFRIVRKVGDVFEVSILLGQWITLEGFGVVAPKNRLRKFQSFWVNGLLWKIIRELPYCVLAKFQSFWVNGLLWKQTLQFLHLFFIIVSILLVQWITLEGRAVGLPPFFSKRFNPSGSMDYFGSSRNELQNAIRNHVSILLVQWITLEVRSKACVLPFGRMFQSFWFNGLLWKNHSYTD